MVNKIVHVGHPKAGSSYLQRSIFPFLTDYQYFNYTKGKKFYHYLVNSGIFFKKEYANDLIQNPDKNFILSNELLIGNPISGIGINSETIPKKLKECGFNKVIICMRKDHDKWIRSLYNEFIKLGGKLNYSDFITSPQRYNSEYTLYYPEMINRCEEYVKYYQDVFGYENVLVLFIEDLKVDPKKFIDSVLKFLSSSANFIKPGRPANESMHPFMLGLLRFLNNFLSSRIAPASSFQWLSSARVFYILQLFSRRSIRKSNSN